MNLFPVNKKQSVYYKILLFLLIPVILISLISFVTYTYYLKLYEREINSKYRKSLTTISSRLDNTFYELLETGSLLSLNNSLREIIFANKKLKLSNYYDVSKSIEVLSHFRSSRNIIDNAYLIDKKTGIVISSNGVHEIDRFFEKAYHYQEYDKEYWMNLTTKDHKIEILYPSRVFNYFKKSNSRRIIPVIQRGMGYEKANKLFVINIKQQELMNFTKDYELTPNSFFVIADIDGNIYSTTASDNLNNLKITDSMIRQAKDNGSLSFNYQGKEMQMLAYNSPSSLFNNFIYLAIIPQQDIYNRMSYVKNLSYITIIAGLILGLILAWMMSKKLYKPISSLVKLLKGMVSEELVLSYKDEFEYLKNEIEGILNKNESLSKGMSIALPIMAEQYLLKVLNNNEPYVKQEVKDYLSKNNINFAGPSFIVAIIDLNYSDQFFEKYSQNERMKIRDKILNIIKNVFIKKFNIYVLTLEKDKLGIIINNFNNSLDEIIDHFQRLYEVDHGDNLVLHIGLGKIYTGLKGMQQSYQEARKAVAQTYLYDMNNIKVYDDATNHNNYFYSLSEEQKMFNYLICGEKVKALELLENIIIQNKKLGVSCLIMRELYLQLYNTGYRALRTKDMLPQKVMEESYQDVKNIWQDLSISRFNKYIYLFFEKIADLSNISSSQVKIDEIIKYINTNFTEDIYLEQLADQYNTSAKYLSQLIKDTLGISFKKYLNKLRIEKTKILLQQDNELIKEICFEVGYNNRTTFIRNFKKITGVTPSEYQEHNL